jgi:hypothetical protein
MTIKIDVKSNLKQFTKGLNDFKRKQVPFATSRALNNTAFDLRKHQISEVLNKDLSKNTAFYRKLLRVFKSTKTNLEARVFDQLGKDYMEKLTRGYVKTATRGRRVAIPFGKLYRSRAQRKKAKDLLRNRSNFLIRTKRSGQVFVAKRMGRERFPLDLLLQLKTFANVRKKLFFYEKGEKQVLRTFGKEFIKEFDKALRTAKFKN